MKNKILYVLFLFLFLQNAEADIDPNIFFIKPKNFKHKAYTDKTSAWEIISLNKEFTLPGGPFQKIVKTDVLNKKKIITIKTGEQNLKIKKLIKNKKAYLADSRLLLINSPKIKELAVKYKNYPQPIAAIEKFVFNYITKKTVGIPLISAESILKLRAGDCTEHTVLSVALLRAARIPARAVLGIYLAPNFMGHKDVFVFHMWAEAYYKGKWQLLDATRPGSKKYSYYITLGYHSLKSVMSLEYADMSSKLQDLQIRYIE